MSWPDLPDFIDCQSVPVNFFFPFAREFPDGEGAPLPLFDLIGGATPHPLFFQVGITPLPLCACRWGVPSPRFGHEAAGLNRIVWNPAGRTIMRMVGAGAPMPSASEEYRCHRW